MPALLKSLTALALLAGCSAASPEYDVPPEMLSTPLDAAPEAPPCVTVTHAFIERFGQYGLETIQGALDDWMVSTGREPGTIAVTGETDCRLIVDSAELEHNFIGRFHDENRITINSLRRVGMPCEDEETRFHLHGILLHEFAHAFGCSCTDHGNSSDLLSFNAKTCYEYYIDDVAAQCGQALTPHQDCQGRPDV